MRDSAPVRNNTFSLFLHTYRLSHHSMQARHVQIVVTYDVCCSRGGSALSLLWYWLIEEVSSKGVNNQHNDFLHR